LKTEQGESATTSKKKGRGEKSWEFSSRETQIVKEGENETPQTDAGHKSKIWLQEEKKQNILAVTPELMLKLIFKKKPL